MGSFIEAVHDGGLGNRLILLVAVSLWKSGRTFQYFFASQSKETRAKIKGRLITAGIYAFDAIFGSHLQSNFIVVDVLQPSIGKSCQKQQLPRTISSGEVGFKQKKN